MFEVELKSIFILKSRQPNVVACIFMRSICSRCVNIIIAQIIINTCVCVYVLFTRSYLILLTFYLCNLVCFYLCDCQQCSHSSYQMKHFFQHTHPYLIWLQKRIFFLIKLINEPLYFGRRRATWFDKEIADLDIDIFAIYNLSG